LSNHSANGLLERRGFALVFELAADFACHL
jgi:hypothetical protein